MKQHGKVLRSIIVLLISIFLSLSGCNKPVKQKVIPKIDLPEIANRGKLVAITGYNAYSYFIYKGEPMGYDYELVNKLAEFLNLRLEIKIVKDINKMFEMLNNGEGDIITFNLTVTKERSKKVAFTKPLYTTRQVLVQRKPKGWRRMKLHTIQKKIINSPLELEGKTVYVRSGSAFLSRLKNLSDEIGGEINIVEADPDLSVEDLIRMVAEGKIDYTIADENVALLNKSYYTDLDVHMAVSFPQKIAWAVRKNSPALLDTVNHWLNEIDNTLEFYMIYKKYFTDRRRIRKRLISEFATFYGGKISPYDEEIKKYAKSIGWDWRLLASLIYQESQFNPKAKSWAGAVGLMQLLPSTAKHFGAKNPHDPIQSLEAGVKYLKWLDDLWSKYVKDNNERIKFVLASYNIGFGHILDARKLAEKYGANPNIWENNVEFYLLKKSEPKFYNDEVVRNGYCSGVETVNYVREILDRYEKYKQFVK